MDPVRSCICIKDDLPSLDFATVPEEEDEEIDEDELVEDQIVPHNLIWQDILNEFNEKREQTLDYINSKQQQCEVPLNSTIQFFQNCFSDLLTEILVAVIKKAIEEDSLMSQTTTFNGIDYISQMLWNKNPFHADRETNWTYIFDMDWVIEYLKDCPRPYYPLSWIWTPDVAATKIQAYLRGYWVRREEDVQEMRQFWIIMKQEKEAERCKEEAEKETEGCYCNE